MRLRSTGLGKTELVANIGGLENKGSHLTLSVYSIEPVRWHIRACMGYSDLIALIKQMIRPSVLRWVIFGWASKKSKELIDF